MPYYYYTKEFEIGQNGEKVAFLMIDSCLLLCSNYSYGKMVKKNENIEIRPFQSHDQEIKNLKDSTCAQDILYMNEGNKMYEWILQTLEKWKNDPKIIWKVSVQHHPLFGKWYDDMQHLTSDFLPILLENKFDLYLNGHEHDLEHAYYPYAQAPDDVNSEIEI